MRPSAALEIDYDHTVTPYHVERWATALCDCHLECLLVILALLCTLSFLITCPLPMCLFVHDCSVANGSAQTWWAVSQAKYLAIISWAAQSCWLTAQSHLSWLPEPKFCTEDRSRQIWLYMSLWCRYTIWAILKPHKSPYFAWFSRSKISVGPTSTHQSCI